MMRGEILHIIFWMVVNSFILWAIREFVIESANRGVWGGFLFFLVWNGLWLISLISGAVIIVTYVEWGILAIVLILLIPSISKKDVFPDFPNERVDERDVMFARAGRKEGTESYKKYYKLRPYLKPIDDHLRSLPGLCSPDSLFYDPEPMKQADQYFEDIGKITVDQKSVTSYVNLCKKSSNLEKTLKQIVLELGAVDVGISKLYKEFVYTYKGRFDSDFGKKINLNHTHVIVFLVEMDYNRMQKAPYAETILESARQYYRAAKIAKYLEKILQQLGYEAKAQYDAHYDVILPPLAVTAGLGEIGRNNILISRKWGSRVRIGAVTTNLPLKSDSPIFLNAEKFCRICKKCATACPSKSLLLEDKALDRGVRKWKTRQESCYAYWRRAGTDCGICMAHCPYSKPNTLFHNLIRKWITYSELFPYVALWMDDRIYGKKWKNPTTKSP